MDNLLFGNDWYRVTVCFSRYRHERNQYSSFKTEYHVLWMISIDLKILSRIHEHTAVSYFIELLCGYEDCCFGDITHNCACIQYIII